MMKLSKRQLTIIITIVVLLLGAAIWFFADPVEYFRRLRDRRLENAAGDFLTASQSYYKIFFDYPWSASATDPEGTAVQSSWLEKLVDGEVVSTEFANRSYWSQIFITRREGLLYACFTPLSKEYKGLANAQGWRRDGTSGCADGCFSCVFENE